MVPSLGPRNIVQGNYRSVCAYVFSQLMRLKINILWNFMSVLVLKRNSHILEGGKF